MNLPRYMNHFCALALGLVLIANVPSHGQIVVQAPLAEQVRAAKGGFVPVTPADVAAARNRLDWALYQLDLSFFASGEQNRNAWWNFLKWTDLQRELAKPAPDLNVLRAVIDQFRKNEAGLEQSLFTSARDALAKYATLLEVTADKDMAGDFANRIEQLAGELTAYETAPTVDNLIAVAQSLGWFEKRGQIPQVISAIRVRHQQDNLQVFVSERLLSRNINRCVQESSPVKDCILGTSIVGNATMNGQSWLRMVPNASQAQLDIALNGCIHSNTVGYNRSVQIYSTGNTNVNASKSLFMTPDHLFGTPAIANCNTNTSVNDITASKLPRLVTKIAWKKVGQQKGEAEAIASQRAEERVSHQMDEQAAPMIVRQNQELQEMKYPLVRKNAVPQRMSLSSTSHELVLHALRWGTGQLSANSAPPPTITPWDITAQVHETTVINFGESYLSNFTLTDENLEKMLAERGEVPEELKVTEDKDPWSLTFADEIPVRAKFENERVTIAIRGKRFTRGDQKINDQMEISAEYQVQILPTGSKFVRVGDVKVDYFKLKGQQGATQVAFKTFMRRKFDAVFKPEIEGDGIELTGRASRIGDKLQMQHASFANNWATIGLNSVPKTPKKEKPKAAAKAFVDPNETAEAERKAAQKVSVNSPL